MPSKLVALSIGSDKITAAMSIENNGEFEILDTIEKKSNGIKKGRIIYGELVLECIKELLEELAQKNECEIKSLYINLNTENVRLINSKGVYKSEFQSTVLTPREVSKAYINGKNVEIEDDEYIVDAIINGFYTKENGYIDMPIGLKASSLEVELDVVVAKKDLILDYKTLFLNTGYEIKGFILGIEALRNIFLGEGTKTKSTLIIDFGAQKIEMAYFENNKIKDVRFLGLGADSITNDLSIIMKKNLEIARGLKEKYSENYVTLRKEFAKLEYDECIVESDLFYDIVNARIEEILSYIKKDLEVLKIYDKIENIIILGDGISQYENILNLIEAVLDKKVVLYTKSELNLENSSRITSIAIVKEVYDRLKLLYKEESFSNKTLMDYKKDYQKEINQKEIKKENKKGLSKLFGFLGDIF